MCQYAVTVRQIIVSEFFVRICQFYRIQCGVAKFCVAEYNLPLQNLILPGRIWFSKRYKIASCGTEFEARMNRPRFSCRNKTNT